MTEAYPLQWPVGWPRTPAHQRQASRFDPGGLARESRLIVEELRRLGARHAVVSTNVELRLDGLPYSNRRAPDDPGVAVYFELEGRPQCIPCDRWAKVEENARAIWKSIESLRGLERWGAKSFVDAAFRGFEALPAPSADNAAHWTTVLGVGRAADADEINAAYRKKAREAHPDAGGTVEAMSALNAARTAALAERGAT
ncbi:DnaJ domain-containing protein [Microbaculum marinum]|uniref:DnaJ domain-containing protein n=1 Tax=Microbaculum marinum TaxID=1764581 RepID=A0AAW9RNA9_9HYPH